MNLARLTTSQRLFIAQPLPYRMEPDFKSPKNDLCCSLDGAIEVQMKDLNHAQTILLINLNT
jgi:hypothetical protein